MSPLGAGVYDDLCTYVREKAKAHSAIVMVFGGEHGAGFSCQAIGEVLLDLPRVLRVTADQIEKSGERS